MLSPDDDRKQDGEKSLPASDQFDFNQAAEHDIAAALDRILAIKTKERYQEKSAEHAEPLRIDAIGYCMGGAILAEALLKDSLLDGSQPIRKRLSHVVLMTIGLFYQMNVHGRMKAEAHLLKRVISDEPDRHMLDPRVDKESGGLPKATWPDFVETLYQVWRHPYDKDRMDREHIPKEERHVLEMFNRVSFMFGEPYQETNLVPEIHHKLTYLSFKAGNGVGSIAAGTLIEALDEDRIVARGELAYPFAANGASDGGKSSTLVLCRCNRTPEQERYLVEDMDPPAEQKEFLFWTGLSLLADGQSIGKVDDRPGYREALLPDLFGAMPVHLFMHGAENLRAGVATDLRQDVDGKNGGEKKQDNTPAPVLDAFKDNEADAYKGFAALDHLTLIGGGLNRLWHRDSVDRMGAWLERHPRIRRRWTKHMLLDYGHQDLLWGRKASEDVFPKILAGLGQTNKAGTNERSENDDDRGRNQSDTGPESAA